MHDQWTRDKWSLTFFGSPEQHQPNGNSSVYNCAVCILTVASGADDWDVFPVQTVVNSPATMSACSYRHLIASTLEVVQPDWSCATAVVVTQIQTGSPEHTSTVHPKQQTSTNAVTKVLRNSTATFTGGISEILNTSPKSEHIAGDLCVCVVKAIITHSSPDTVVVDFKTSGIKRSVITGESHRH